MTKKMTHLDEALICREYESGESFTSLAKKYKVSAAKIGRVLREHHVFVRAAHGDGKKLKSRLEFTNRSRKRKSKAQLVYEQAWEEEMSQIEM